MYNFRLVYNCGNIYNFKDTIDVIDKRNIDFENIENEISNNLDIFRCNIMAPLNKLYAICCEEKFKNCNFIIIFDDCMCEIIRGNITISNDEYDSKSINKNIIFNDREENQYSKVEYSISSYELINIFINKLKSIDLSTNIIENVKLLETLYDRSNCENIIDSNNFNNFYNLLLNKTFELVTKLNIDNINNNSEVSLIQELFSISKLESNYTVSDMNCNLFTYYKKNLPLLLSKIKKLINDDYIIRNYKINTKKYENKIYESSKNFYYSVITRTNWLDELEYGNITGLLVKIDPKEINKNTYNMDYIPIMDITHTIISLEQILEAYKIFYQQFNTLFDNEIKENIISGFGIGNGNCIIPLYINSDHWNLVKIYNEYNNGIIFYRNPLISRKKHINVYYNITLNMINLTFSDENYNSDKWIQLLFSMLRTVYEISKYDNKEIQRFKNDLNFRVDCNINKILVLMLFSNDNDCIKYVIEEQIRRKMKSMYRDINVLDSIYEFNKQHVISSLVYEYDNICNNVSYDIINQIEYEKLKCNLEDNEIFSKLITTIHSIISMRSIIKNKYKLITNEMDQYGGILKTETLIELKKEILDNLIKPTNYNLNSIMNEKFASHNNITKRKKFKIDTLYNNYIIKQEIELVGLLIQCIIQRVNKCKKKAIKNNKIYCPFTNPDKIIKNTGLLISSRHIREFYKLTNNINSYINCINTLRENSLDFILFLLHIRKTLSIKDQILNSITNINSELKKIIINNLFRKNKLPEENLKYKILL